MIMYRQFPTKDIKSNNLFKRKTIRNFRSIHMIVIIIIIIDILCLIPKQQLNLLDRTKGKCCLFPSALFVYVCVCVYVRSNSIPRHLAIELPCAGFKPYSIVVELYTPNIQPLVPIV
jgi:SNF family Na+-dependent transporter